MSSISFIVSVFLYSMLLLDCLVIMYVTGNYIGYISSSKGEFFNPIATASMSQNYQFTFSKIEPSNRTDNILVSK